MDSRIDRLVRSRIRDLKTEGLRTVSFEAGLELAKDVPLSGHRFLILDSDNGVVAGADGGLSQVDFMKVGGDLVRTKIWNKLRALADGRTG